MKKIIKKILKNHGEMNSNLGSKTVRDIIAIEIIERLKKKGFYTEYRKDELEKREAKKGWVCQTCGKSTFETEYDYLVHPKLHLGCALKEEMDGNDIKEQYHKASAEYYKDKNVVRIPTGGEGSHQEISKGMKSLVNKLSEEIVDNKDVKYIYESPDGGKTIYRREFGSDEKELIKNG